MKKIDVNGDRADPLYEYLKSTKPGMMGMKRMYVFSTSPRPCHFPSQKLRD
jgi:glutathione peroxidase-family protein